MRRELADAERASGAARADALRKLSAELDGDRAGSCDQPKVDMLKKAVNDLLSPVAM